MIAEDCSRTHVDHDEQPYPFHLEFVFKSKRIPNNHLEANVEPVTIKLDDLIRARRNRRRRGASVWQSLEVRRAGRAGRRAETAEQLGLQPPRQ
ncbi:hypothetical protein D9M70_633700 [compost metagenome]